MKIRVMELFSGYGSQAMALKRLQKSHPDLELEFVGISEIEPNAIMAYKAVHGEVKNYGDVSKVDWNSVPDIDLITYSFPCQAISAAGLQQGLKEGSGTTSSLVWEALKAISIKRPKYAIMENVKALASKKFMPDFLKVQKCLEEMGYSNYWQILNAKDFGVPQNRERVFMVSILSEHKPYVFPKPIPLEKRLIDVLEDSVDESYYLPQEKTDMVIAKIDPDELAKIAQAALQKQGLQGDA